MLDAFHSSRGSDLINTIINTITTNTAMVIILTITIIIITTLLPYLGNTAVHPDAELVEGVLLMVLELRDDSITISLVLTSFVRVKAFQSVHID